MPLRVIVLAERSTELLADWDIPTGSRVASPHWEEVTLGLVRRARLHGDGGGEVYCCLIGDSPEELDHNFLERLAHQSARHAWGSKVFLVVDPRNRFAEESGDFDDAVDEWYETAHRFGFRLVEASCPTGPQTPLSPKTPRILRDACDRVQHRENLARRFNSSLSWRATLASIQSALEQVQKLIRPYLLHEAAPAQDSNLLVLTNESDEGFQYSALTGSIDGRLKDFSRERLLIGTVGVKAKGRLRDFCLGEQLDLIYFPGIHELRSFMQRISPQTVPAGRPLPKGRDRFSEGGLEVLYGRAHERFRLALQGSGAEDGQRTEAETLEARLLENLADSERHGAWEDNGPDRSRIVDSLNHLARRLDIPSFTSFLREELPPVLRQTAGRDTGSPPSPTLLVTHAFNPDTERERCLQAAAFVGSLLKEIVGMAPGAGVRVHLAVTRIGLQDMMSGMDRLTAWIFLGPAGGPEGLWDIGSDGCLAAAEWAVCFHGQEKQPALALFLAGRSEETARHFAESGVACAIGFAGEIPPESPPFPFKGVFHHTLTNGVDCREIESLLSSLAGIGEIKVFCAGPP